MSSKYVITKFLFLLSIMYTVALTQDRTVFKTAEMNASIDLKSFDTGVDSLNRLLKSLSESVVRFKGKMGIDYINTRSHPPQSFDIVGNLTLNSVTKQVVFKATLTHLSNEYTIACMLSANTTLTLKDFNLNKSLPGFSESLNVGIVQAVLRREGR